VAILLIVLVAAAPWIVAHTPLRDTAINSILASPSVTASSDAASFGWFSPLSLQGLQLKSTNNHVAIRVDDITAERSLWELWSSAPDLGTIRVDKVHVQLQLPLDIQVEGPSDRLEPTFTAIVKNAALTVRLAGQEEPAIDVHDLNLTFRVERAGEGRALTVDPIVIFDRLKVSPKLASRLLHLFDPTMGDTPQISGEVSLSLDKLRIPLGVSRDQAVQHMEMEGKLVLHDVSTEITNPMRQALVQLVADMNGKDASKVVRLIQTAEIHFQVREGRMYHEGLRIGFPDIDPDLQLTSRGWVGLDKTLDLFVDLPRLDPVVRKERGPARCRITGTFDKAKITVEDATLALRQHEQKGPILFADGINLTMQVEDTASGRVLVVEPVEVFKKTKLNLGVASGLVALVSPDVQGERQVSGEISLSLDKLRIPLGVPREQAIMQLEVEGKLTLHGVSTEIKSAIWQGLVRLLADMHGKPPASVFRLVEESQIHFKVRDGRLYHDGQRLGFPEIDPDLVVSSRGSIGLDETLDLHLELPQLLPDKRNRSPLQCAVSGTLGQPTIDVPGASLVIKLTDGDRPALVADNVDLRFRVEESRDGRMLTLAPVTVFNKQKLTPQVCDQLLRLVAPTLTDLTDVQGEISLHIDTFRIPLGAPQGEFAKRVELAGKLQMHQISVTTKTPLLQTLVKVLADMHGKKPSDIVRVVKNAEVRFQVRDGRIHHEGLRLGFPDISPELLISSSGSVGLDKSLDLVLEVPSILLDKTNPDIKVGPPVRFHVTGTIDDPKVTEIGKEKTNSAMLTSRPMSAPVQRQDPPVQPSDIKAIVRISKKLIEDVAAGEEIVATVPYCENVMGFCCQGVVHGRAKLSVEMTTDHGNATFVVCSQGTAETYARGVRGPIAAIGQGWGNFATRTLVRFEGRKFTMLETTPWAEVHGQLERVEGRRGGPVGRAVGRVVRPLGELLVPRAEVEAVPIGERLLSNFVNQVAGDVVEKLNRTTAVEKSLNRLFPQTRDWIVQMSSDSQFLQAAYGPRGCPVPVLPENPGRLKDVRLELWLHSAAQEAQDLVKLSQQPLARQLVQRYLETTLPELAALADNRSLDAVGPWLVISIGSPKVNTSSGK
jgi:hypothetical protein